MSTLLIRHIAQLVTCDDRDRILQNADLYCEDGFIKSIGTALDVTADEVIDGRHMLCYPGLVNTHHHLYQVFSRNLPQVQNMELFDWLKTLYEIWKNLDEDVIRLSSLTGMGELMKSAPADKHLLILLTDASPNDSHKILPSGKIPLSRDYDGQPGIDDTAAEVRALRAQGIRVAAVFMGENAGVPAANAIYGRDLARIRRIDQLAAAAGRLIQDEIRELSG